MTPRPTETPPAPRRRLPRAAYLVAGALAAAALAAGAWWLWLRPAPLAIPAVDLQGMDPKVARAIESARQGVAEAPGSAAAWGKLGMVLRAHDYGEEANACFAEAERLDPKDPRWPYHRGLALIISDPDAGLDCLRRAADLGGKVNSPTLVLAENLVARGQTDEAAGLFEKVLRAEPDNPRAHHGLGRIAYLRGDLPASLRHLTAAAREAPRVQATHTLLAEIHFARGERKLAEEERELAAQLSPTASWPDEYLDEVARLRLGLESRISQAAALIQEGLPGDAVRLLGDAAAEYPDSFDVFLSLGKANLRLQPPDYPAAERAFRAAARLRPDDPAAHFHLGISLEQQGRHKEAEAAYAQAVALKPDYAFAHYNRGQCLLRLGDRPGAREAFRAAARARPNFAEAHRELGALLGEEREFGEALERLEQATRLAPKDARARQLLDELRKKAPAPR